jgi:hypothetical protein
MGHILSASGTCPAQCDVHAAASVCEGTGLHGAAQEAQTPSSIEVWQVSSAARAWLHPRRRKLRELRVASAEWSATRMRAQRSREVERDACWVRRPMRSDLQVVLIDPAPSLRPSIWKNLCDLALELAAGLSVQRGRKNLNEMGGSVACAGSDEP